MEGPLMKPENFNDATVRSNAGGRLPEPKVWFDDIRTLAQQLILERCESEDDPKLSEHYYFIAVALRSTSTLEEICTLFHTYELVEHPAEAALLLLGHLTHKPM